MDLNVFKDTNNNKCDDDKKNENDRAATAAISESRGTNSSIASEMELPAPSDDYHVDDDEHEQEKLDNEPKPGCCNGCCESSCCKKCKRCPGITVNFIKPKIAVLVALFSRYTALLDMVIDFRLLYKSAESNYLFLTVSLFVCMVAPYLLQYSCGIKLFTLQRTFDKLSGFASIFVVLYLMPTGVLYFVLLDIFDMIFSVYAVIASCLGKSDQEIKNNESMLSEQLGLSHTDWEGLKRQKVVGQLMFETIPQTTIQSFLFLRVIPGIELTNITQSDLLISIGSAIFSSIMQVTKLYFEAGAVQESFFQYSLTCFMARIGWVPYRTKMRRVLENKPEKAITSVCKCGFGIEYITDSEEEDRKQKKLS